VKIDDVSISRQNKIIEQQPMSTVGSRFTTMYKTAVGTTAGSRSNNSNSN